MLREAAVTDRLVDAVHEHRLAEVAEAVLAESERSAVEHEEARRALATCDRIGASLETEAARMQAVLADAGVPVGAPEAVDRRQNHTIVFPVADVDVAERAADAIEPLGFERWERWERGARESFRRTADQMTVARTDGRTLVVRFRWNPRRARTVIERAVTPNAGDWHLVGLPVWAWRVYPVVRVVRLAAERAGLRQRHRASLGPFLSTPDDLLPALLRHADIDEHDLLVDLGCGDGRVVVTAARLVGCAARGVETDAQLVVRARQRVVEAGVVDRVRVVEGDARGAGLSDATVVFVFLPIDVLADLLPDLLARMRPGARLIAHEQTRPPVALSPPPTDSTLVLGDESVTVAYRWVS